MEPEINTPQYTPDESALDEMRAQIVLLREKLDRETIINDRLLREAMRGKIGILRRHAIYEYACAVICFILYPTVFIRLGFTWWFVGFTLVMMAFCAILTAVQHRHMNALDEGEDLLTMARYARCLRQRYVDWLKWSILIILFWFSLLITECFLVIPDRKAGIVMAVGCAIGLVIGAAISMKMRRNIIKTCDEMVKEIEG